MSDDLYHLTEAPDFEYEQGQAFRLAYDEDPDEYWYVLSRVWNYDVDVGLDDAGPPAWYHKQYEIGEVSSLGGNPRMITEKDLREQYEPVDTETASEVI